MLKVLFFSLKWIETRSIGHDKEGSKGDQRQYGDVRLLVDLPPLLHVVLSPTAVDIEATL